MINPTIEPIVHEFKAALRALYGDRLRDVVLYGSYARGDYDDESDIDLMVVLTDEKVDAIAEGWRLSELTMEFIYKHGKAFSALPVTATKYATSYMPVYQNARREGLRV